ncbi:MAG TPA: hypothetical protein VHL11_10410 [Phototrophicaceae bacterium]|jgi:hypothetical protein|nr:hypothetical protein [Phototrophicaceae bacterium]
MFTFSLTSTVTGQNIAPSSVETPEATILHAIELMQEQSYRFTGETLSRSQLTIADNTPNNSVSIYTVAGIVKPGGDRQLNIKMFFGNDALLALLKQPLIVDLIRLDGEQYINIISSIDYMEFVEPGWERYDDIISQYENPGSKVLLDYGVNYPVPFERKTLNELDKTVTELAPETIGGVSMRVFDVKINMTLDTLKIMMAQAQVDGTEAQRQAYIQDYFSKNGDLIDLTRFSSEYRLWISADDGLPRRGVATTHAFYPNMTSTDGADDPHPLTYDIEQESTGSFKIIRYGVDQAITAPEVVKTP